MTVMVVLLLVPITGLTFSHAASPATHPPLVRAPLLVIFNDFALGSAAFCMAAKLKLLESRVICGAGERTVYVTATVWGLLTALLSVTVIVALYCPGERSVLVTVTVTVPLLVPEVGPTVNHVLFTETLQFKVPLPVLAILNDLALGNDPFCTASKLMLEESSEITGRPLPVRKFFSVPSTVCLALNATRR